MTYIVKIADKKGSFTKPGYETLEAAVGAARSYGWKIVEMYGIREFSYARVYDENGMLRYDWAQDAYYGEENPPRAGIQEEAA